MSSSDQLAEPAVAAPRGVLARIQSVYPSLSASEAKVADLLRADPDLVVRLPINELASHIGVSDATIIRSCRSLGYDGLRSLKLALAAESSSPSRWLVREAVTPEDSTLTIAEKVLRSDMQAISDTLSVLDEDTLEAVVDAIVGASRIEFCGLGSSVPVALDAYYRVVRLGLPATIVTDPHMQAISAAHLPPGSVAIAISYSGRNPQTRAALSKAKLAGATTVLLTSFRHTPIGELADLEIVTPTTESTLRPDAVSSRVAQLAVVDALSVAIAVREPERARRALLEDDDIIAERELPG